MTLIYLPAYAKQFGPSYYRGPTYELWTFANGQRQWISATQNVWNSSHWVDYIFQDLYDAQGKYVIQTGLIAVEIFDYYAKFYDPNMTEVRLYDERWEIQRWKTTGQGSWSNIGAQSGKPVFTISHFKNGVNVTKSFHSWAGWLNITYTFSENLKHTVTWQQEMGTPQTFGVLQKWSGIVGAKVRHEQGTINILSPTQVNGTYFEFLKNNYDLSIIENQWSARQHLKPVTIDLHAQGMKCDFIFSNWTLSDRQSLTIDPTTYTVYSSDWDGYVVNGNTDQATIQSASTGSHANYNVDTFYFGWLLDDSHWHLHRLYFIFSTYALPDDAIITSAKLCLYGYQDLSVTDFTINIQNWTEMDGLYPSTSDYDAFDGVNYDDGAFSTSSWSTSGYNNITLSNFTIIETEKSTAFCVRASNDIGTPYPANNSCVLPFFSDATGTSKDPLLEIIYVPEPTISEFTAPNTAYSDTKFSLACTVTHDWGVAYFDYVTIELSASVILKWDNTTDTFSEHSDTNNLCILFADESEKTVVSGTEYTLTWKISLSANFPKGSVDVVATNTKVFDAYGQSGSGSESDLFEFEPTTVISGSGEVDEEITDNGFLGLPPTKIVIPTWGYWVIGGTIALMGIGALMQSGKKKRRVRGVRTQQKTHKPKRTKKDTRGRFK